MQTFSIKYSYLLCKNKQANNIRHTNDAIAVILLPSPSGGRGTAVGFPETRSRVFGVRAWSGGWGGRYCTAYRIMRKRKISDIKKFLLQNIRDFLFEVKCRLRYPSSVDPEGRHPSRCGSVTPRVWQSTGLSFNTASPLRYPRSGRRLIG